MIHGDFLVLYQVITTFFLASSAANVMRHIDLIPTPIHANYIPGMIAVKQPLPSAFVFHIGIAVYDHACDMHSIAKVFEPIRKAFAHAPTRQEWPGSIMVFWNMPVLINAFLKEPIMHEAHHFFFGAGPRWVGTAIQASSLQGKRREAYCSFRRQNVNA